MPLMAEHLRTTEELAAFVHDLSDRDIPAAVKERVKDLLIDAIACALAADKAEEISQLDALADLLGSAPEATVAGRHERRSLAAATLLNAYRITALTACDVYTPAHFHVTPEVVPPALAIAEQRAASGRDLLVAVTAGLEVATRVASGLDYATFRARGWHTPGVAGPFGGAAAVGKLAGLDTLRLRNGLGLAGSQAAGTWAAWGTPTVKFHQARAALSGLLAGLLAETGFAAAEDVLTNPDGGLLAAYAGGGRPDLIVADLGERWELTRISLRPWPGATPLQPVITALFQLIEAGRLPSTHVRAVRIFVAPAVKQQHARFRHPTGTFEAMLSVDYAAAALVRYGRLGIEEFLPATYGQRELHDLIDKQIEVEVDPALSPLACRVEVTDDTGGIDVTAVDLPKGHPDDPAPRELLVEKFRRFAVGVLEPSSTEEVLRQLADLEDVHDTRQLCQLLRPARR
jgi:2-methylcitrate dehydratase PrpD